MGIVEGIYLAAEHELRIASGDRGDAPDAKHMGFLFTQTADAPIACGRYRERH